MIVRAIPDIARAVRSIARVVNVTHRFLCCLRSLCSFFNASPMLLKAVACVVRVFHVLYVPVSVPPNVPPEALQPVFNVFRVYCVSHHCYQHHFSAL